MCVPPMGLLFGTPPGHFGGSLTPPPAKLMEELLPHASSSGWGGRHGAPLGVQETLGGPQGCLGGTLGNLGVP